MKYAANYSQVNSLLIAALLAVGSGLRDEAHGEPIPSGDSVPALAREADSGPEYARTARALIRQGDTTGALQALRQGAADDPLTPPAEMKLAELLIGEGQSQQGLLMLEQAVLLHPDDPQPHLVLADIAWRDRRLSDAQLQYAESQRLAADLPVDSPRRQRLQSWAAAGLGSVAETRGQLETARKLFADLLEGDPGHMQARIRLGNVLFAMGREEEAFDQFKIATAQQAAAPPAELVMANLYRRSGETAKARQSFDKSVSQAPENLQCRVARIDFLLKDLNDVDAAAEDIQAARELAPEARQFRQLTALIDWRRGDLASAVSLLEPLVLETPDDPESSAYLAAVLAEQGGADRLSRALQIASLNASAHPEAAIAQWTLGWVANLAGQTDAALRRLQTAAAADADRDAKYYLARALYRSGQSAAAREQLSAALEGNGFFVHLNDARRWGEKTGLQTAP